MFGFIRPQKTDLKTAKPAAKASGILVTKEDIYRENKGMEPILLLRKGYEVTPEELPRFIRNGAKPHQFQFKHNAESLASYKPPQAPLVMPQQAPISPAPMRRSHPAPALPATPAKTQNLARKKVLILEPDPKSMKRLIDCLFICGLHLDRIHPVRLPEHLAWTAEKYRPHILIVDHHLPGHLQNGLDILSAVTHLPWLEKVILTLAPNQVLTADEQHAWEILCQEKEIKILTKPVNRHTLNQLLSDT